MGDTVVTFRYGSTINPEEMAPGTIYLDGACRGPKIDVEKRSYSFDHHAECSRFATLSTCEQVLLALDLGFNPEGMEIVLNDLDADGSLSLWLLMNPDKVDDRVRNLVRAIGFVDSHGPVRKPEKLHKILSRNPRVAQTRDMMWEDQQHICCWYDHGDEQLPEPFAFPPCPVHGVDKNGNVVEVSGDFAAAYAAGAIMALAKVPGPEGTFGWTVGKRSDFAPGDIPGFLAAMNEIEDGWGGGSTIGGAPRKEGGLRSSLGWDTVWPVFLKFA
jgi:hypothetical protein